MPRSLSIIAVLLWLASVPLPLAIGQMAGSRGARKGPQPTWRICPSCNRRSPKATSPSRAAGRACAAHGRPRGAGSHQ